MNFMVLRLFLALALCSLGLLQGCKNNTQPSPAVTLNQEQIQILIQRNSIRRDELDLWSADVLAALRALKIEATKDTVCAVVSVVEQESNFNADPKVAGLSGMVKRRFEKTKEQPLLFAGLQLRLGMPHRENLSFKQTLEKVQTERDLEMWYADFTASSLTKPALLLMEKDIDSLIATIGSMQVSVDFAREHAARNGIVHRNIRKDLYTRYWGLYYGIAHLLDYERPYSDWKYVFAYFNAGHFASRNAAFQKMVAQLSKQKLSQDGDLLNYQAGGDKRSKTYDAVVKLLSTGKDVPTFSPDDIYADLRKEKTAAFIKTKTYEAVARLYEKKYKRVLTAELPEIRLVSDKIRRQLTTGWFANRVDGRHQRCMRVKV
jgi:hypothetical protein